MNTELTINVKVCLDATPRLAELIERLIGQVHNFAASSSQLDALKYTTSAEEAAEEKTEAAPEQQAKTYTEEDIREAMHRARQRIEGEDYKDHPESEAYQKYHKALTSYFKGMAITLGFDKPSAINTQQGRASFIRDCEAVMIMEDGSIGVEAPF